MNNNIARPPWPATLNPEISRDPDYQKIREIVERLWQTGVIDRSRGYCFSLADMVYTLLRHQDVPSEIVECQLTVIRREPQPSLTFLGYDLHKDRENSVDTHVVVVTKTKTPYIIDLSIGHLHPDITRAIVEPLKAEQEYLCQLQIRNTDWIYRRKSHPKFPEYHQQSIIERIEKDQWIERQLRWIKIALTVIIIVTLVNSTRGFYDFYQIHIQDNLSKVD